MKKLLLIFFLSILLSACSSSGSPTETVKEMYNAALNQDSKTFQRILSQNEKIDGHYDEALSELADVIHDLGGIEKLEFTELKKEDLQKQVIEDLDYRYPKGWTMVMVSSKEEPEEESAFFWVLNKVDGNYYVLYGEEMSKESVLKIVNGINIEEEKAKQKKEQVDKEKQERNKAAEQFKAATSKILGQQWKASNNDQTIELTFTDIDEKNINMDEFPSYVSIPIKATAKLTNVEVYQEEVSDEPGRITAEFALEGSLSTYWDNYETANEACENLNLGLKVKNFIKPVQTDFNIYEMGFSAENLNLNNDDTFIVKFYTAPWTGSNFFFTKN